MRWFAQLLVMTVLILFFAFLAVGVIDILVNVVLGLMPYTGDYE